MNLEKALKMLTPEQRTDAGTREMLGDVKTVKAYLWELKEVEKATKRMKTIDLEILQLSPEKQRARQNRIEAQRKAFNELVYVIQNEQLAQFTCAMG